ncbi:MAG: serine hydrolase [Hydrogenophaga sp.]|nr:serine hydrolase [Hydrogenophaga sp.]
MNSRGYRYVFWLVLPLLATPLQAAPDELILGKDQGYPLGTSSTWYRNPHRVGSWSALDRVPGILTRSVQRAPVMRPLQRSNEPVQIEYRFRGDTFNLSDYLERQRTTGLLVLKNGEIVAEHYGYDRAPGARFISFSMAKSVTSLLVGVAHARGAISSLDDVAEKYAPALVGSAYGKTSLRHLLRMSSGLTFTERYDGKDDIARLSSAYSGVAGSGKPIDVLRSIAERHSPAGERFVYAGAETDILGRVLVAATGRSLAELTREWLWHPMGAEHDAFWRIGVDRHEQAYSSFSASLRDWGRLGLLLANDGRLPGPGDPTQVVPRDYLLEATDPALQPPYLRPRQATPYLGYGYQFWILPMRERTFAMLGIHGQAVYVQPSSGLVMVVTSVWENASGRSDPQPPEERDALWRGVLRSLGGSPAE